jgi:hypothetical protein
MEDNEESEEIHKQKDLPDARRLFPSAELDLTLVEPETAELDAF